MSPVSIQRIWVSGAAFGLVAIVAVAAQLRDGIPINAEFGPVETAEVGFMALLTVLSLRVLFLTVSVGSTRHWLLTAAACFATSGINDVAGFTQAISWIEPFDDVSAILSWIGALFLLGAAVRLRSLPTGTSVLIGAGFVFHLATLLIDFGAALPTGGSAPEAGILANLAELAELSAYATYTTGLSLLVWAVLAPVVDDGANAVWPWPMQFVDACELCGSDDLREVVRASATSCRTVLCESCGLMFASPMIHPANLDRFFADGFEGDPGARPRVRRDNVIARKAMREDRSARKWAVPLIERHLSLRGKRVLDIRSRTGTLARAMMERGADVVGLDPLQPNVDYARMVIGLGNIGFMPISELAELRGVENASVDAVTVMTVHILSHLPSPRRHLRRIFEVLRPGGMAFIDEKHALRPVRSAEVSLFGAMPVHTFHFTEATMGRYLRSVGFEIIECDLDRQKTSAFRHIRIVARKPAEPGPNSGEASPISPAERERVIAEITRAQRQFDRWRPLNVCRVGVKRLMRQVWS